MRLLAALIVLMATACSDINDIKGNVKDVNDKVDQVTDIAEDLKKTADEIYKTADNIEKVAEEVNETGNEIEKTAENVSERIDKAAMQASADLRLKALQRMRAESELFLKLSHAATYTGGFDFQNMGPKMFADQEASGVFFQIALFELLGKIKAHTNGDFSFQFDDLESERRNNIRALAFNLNFISPSQKLIQLDFPDFKTVSFLDLITQAFEQKQVIERHPATMENLPTWQQTVLEWEKEFKYFLNLHHNVQTAAFLLELVPEVTPAPLLSREQTMATMPYHVNFDQLSVGFLSRLEKFLGQSAAVVKRQKSLGAQPVYDSTLKTMVRHLRIQGKRKVSVVDKIKNAVKTILSH